jgi:tRNA pseudouridine13 synthase
MKLKSRPDDFHVEELTSIVPQSTGVFPIYRLEKRSLSTPDAIQNLCREWRIDPRRVRYGGLKDRHAWTIQYLTIEGGPTRKFRDGLMQVEHLGYVNEHFGPQSFTGNRFGITLRDIGKEELPCIESEIADVQQGVVANYFDDQRFGSVSDNQFVARALIANDMEQALKLAICSYYEHDRSQEKQAKKLLRAEWGSWNKLALRMPDNHLQKIAWHLHHKPSDFLGAFNYIPFFLRNMYLSAYQSYLWNSILADWIVMQGTPETLISIQQKHGQLPMLRGSTVREKPEWEKLEIPLPSSRYDLADYGFLQENVTRVLAREQLELKDIKLKQFREPFFSKGSRAAWYIPEALKYEVGWDKLHKGNRKVKLIFSLPRGCYATMLVKRVTTAAPWASTSSIAPE